MKFVIDLLNFDNSKIEAEPKNEVVPIKSALKYRSNEQRANTVPIIIFLTVQ